MVEMFRWHSEQLSEKDYLNIKGRLSKICNKEITFTRELNFIADKDMDIAEKFRIIVNRMDKSRIYLIKTREGNDCFIQNITPVSEDELENIIAGEYDEMKESDNELIRDMAWNMELGNYKVDGMTEYIQEKYIMKDSDDEFIFKSLMVDINEGPEKFLCDDLTASDEVDYNRKELVCKRKIHMPLMLKHAV